jgi:transcription initiation factor TFIID subunit 11
MFLGDIIEGARRVQGEWIEKTKEKQADLPDPVPPPIASPLTPSKDDDDNDEESEQAAAKNVATEDRRGPLRPDHLREALRRYKLALEGQGVGMGQAWNHQQRNGVERFPVRTGGRRIFR